MKKILFRSFLILSLIPSYLFGQNIDTTCICGNYTPKINDNIIVEEMAIFPGGVNAFREYLKSSVNFDSSENGEIVISFIISCTGKTCGFQTLKRRGTLTKDTERKLLDALKKMDKWKPAKQRGKAIDIPYTISLNIIDGIFKFSNVPI